MAWIVLRWIVQSSYFENLVNERNDLLPNYKLGLKNCRRGSPPMICGTIYRSADSILSIILKHGTLNQRWNKEDGNKVSVLNHWQSPGNFVGLPDRKSERARECTGSYRELKTSSVPCPDCQDWRALGRSCSVWSDMIYARTCALAGAIQPAKQYFSMLLTSKVFRVCALYKMNP